MYRPTRTWWGEKFLEVLKISMDSGRLSRGKSYSTHRVISFEIKGNQISAKISGNYSPFYRVSFHLKPFSKAKWDRIIKSISQNAAFIYQLFMRDMPAEIETIFEEEKISLLPRPGELFSTCNCPDDASPCKHVAGIYYRIASMLDHDPLLLFQLRGLQFEQLEKKLIESPIGQALIEQKKKNESKSEVVFCANRYPQPHFDSFENIKTLNSCWQGHAPLPEEIITSQDNLIAASLIKIGGDYPAFWSKNASFVSVMEEFYQQIIKSNKGLF